MTVIYTCIIDGYDTLKSAFPLPGTRYICFTDDASLTKEGWETVLIDPGHPDPTRASRIPKILAHRFLDCEESIWIDGSCEIRGDVLRVARANRHDLGLLYHPSRKCLYDEARHIIRRGLDDKDLVERQIGRYQSEEIPRGAGLLRGGFVFRRHTERIKAFNEAWYREYEKGSRRDQISLNYVRRKLSLPVKKYRRMPIRFHRHCGRRKRVVS